MAGNWSALLYLDPPRHPRTPSPAAAPPSSTSQGTHAVSIPSENLLQSMQGDCCASPQAAAASQANLPQTPPTTSARALIIKPQPPNKPQLKPYKLGGMIIIMQNYVRKAHSPITLPDGRSVYPRHYELPPSLRKRLNYSHGLGLAKGAKYPLLDKDGKPIYEGQAFPKYAEVWREGRDIFVKASPMNEEEIALMLEKREKRARRWAF